MISRYRSFSCSPLILSVLVAAWAPVGAGAAVVYRNTFGNATSAYASYSSVGWNVYAANTASDTVRNRSENASGSYGISWKTGSPDDLANINAGTSASLSNGFAILSSGQHGLLFTETYVLDPAALDFDTLAFSWNAAQYRSSTGTVHATMRAALSVNGQWYVSNVLTVPSSATIPLPLPPGTTSQDHFHDFAESFNWSLPGSSWYTLDFTLNSASHPFTIGGSAITEFPAGSIDRFGLYVTAPGSGSIMVDTYGVAAEVIPEPATLSLLLGAFAGFAGCRLARSRRSLPHEVR